VGAHTDAFQTAVVIAVAVEFAGVHMADDVAVDVAFTHRFSPFPSEKPLSFDFAFSMASGGDTMSEKFFTERKKPIISGGYVVK